MTEQAPTENQNEVVETQETDMADLLYGNKEEPAEETPPVEQAEETVADEGAPETYEFKAPEGKEFDKSILESFSKTAKELDLSQVKAQKLLDDIAPMVEKRQMEQVAAVQQEWRESSISDKEFGGDKLDENLGIAKKAIDQFATPEFKEFLQTSGLSNHPEVIRLMYRVGKTISEDSYVGPDRQKPSKKEGPKGFDDYAKALYSKE